MTQTIAILYHYYDDGRCTGGEIHPRTFPSKDAATVQLLRDGFILEKDMHRTVWEDAVYLHLQPVDTDDRTFIRIEDDLVVDATATLVELNKEEIV